MAVNILDRITIRLDDVGTWLERWQREYLPGAQRRGMRVVRRWRSFADVGAITVHVLWEIDGVYPFYGMRGAAGGDPAVAEFWAWADEHVVSRDRSVLEPMGDPS
ncbi:hypothetical protein ABIA39_000662 [Nocardia sp. GAS34]|uniref:hypothetical protein n=1 Tax=unclassified Nocardia TaxID=2637762 RepID=UPI003D252055